MSTVKTTTPVVVAGVPRPNDRRQNEGGRWRKDMRTRQALSRVAVGIGDKGKPLLNRTSSVAGPQMMTESRRG